MVIIVGFGPADPGSTPGGTIYPVWGIGEIRLARRKVYESPCYHSWKER